MRGLVIVPAYNEALSLPAVLASLQREVPSWDVCVVDDGSSDGTSEVAKREGAHVVLRTPVNLGIGGAVQAGYLWARDHRYDVAVQIDGDGQHDPTFIEAAATPILGGFADMVVGSRFLGQGSFRSTGLRRAGIRYLAWLLKLRCGVSVTDPTSGFRVAGRRAIESFAGYYPSDYPEPEAIAVATRQGMRVREVPVTMSPRAHGASSINAWRTLYYLIKVTLALVLLPARHKVSA